MAFGGLCVEKVMYVYITGKKYETHFNMNSTWPDQLQ